MAGAVNVEPLRLQGKFPLYTPLNSMGNPIPHTPYGSNPITPETKNPIPENRDGVYKWLGR